MVGDATTAADERRARRRRGPGVTGVLGEVLITIGVVVLLYVVWQLWVGDWIYGAQNNAAGSEISDQWDHTEAPLPTMKPTDPSATPAPNDVPVLAEAADAEVFGVMRIPRFGPDYATKIAGGVSRARTLDHIGIGHYPGTQMPGEMGNFALAAHRTTWGAPFALIADLKVGDAIVVAAPIGWYTYRFRTLEYVTPKEVDVLLPVPQAPTVAANDRYITLTSCSPRFSLAERIVAYGVFESFQPREDGPPASLSEPLAAAPNTAGTTSIVATTPVATTANGAR